MRRLTSAGSSTTSTPATRALPARLIGASSRSVAGGLVDEDGDPVADRLRVRQPQRLLVARRAEEALPVPQDDGEDHEAQLVDEVPVKEGLRELRAAVDDDV